MNNSKSNSFLCAKAEAVYLRVEWKTSFPEPLPDSGTSDSKAITGNCLSKETKTEEIIAVIMTNYNPMIHLISM